jgi:osmotically-inducible protein OsmY
MTKAGNLLGMSVIALMAAAWGLPAVGAVPAAVTDALITGRVESSFLLNEQLNPFNINTNTKDGVVTLTGSVDDPTAKQLAEDIARSVKGVVDVTNEIKVVAEPPATKPRRSFSQQVRDKSISAAIRSRLLYHKHFSGLKITVKTEYGNVTLAGVVHSEAHKTQIANIAATTRGVEKVNNLLTVAPKEALEPMDAVERDFADEWVEKRVETALLMNRHIALSSLNVEVNDGLCILTGQVDSDVQKELAESIALSVQGVENVQNDIQVEAPVIELEPIVPQE